MKINNNVIGYHDIINLSGGQAKSTIEVLKVGMIRDRGMKITSDQLDQFIQNFQDNVYGTPIQVNLGHDRDGEAAGWVTELRRDGDTLLAEVEWTPLGVNKITSKQYQFTSSELALSYPDAATGEKKKNVFIGVALTNVPAVKGMSPVSLSENLQLYLNSQNMKLTPEQIAELSENMSKDHKALMAKATLTKSDMAEFTKNHGDNDGHGSLKEKLEEKYAEQKGGKKSKPAEDDGEDDDDDEDEKDESEKVKKNSERQNNVQLSEIVKLRQRIVRAEEKNAELAEKIERQNLSEQVETDLMLSDERGIGFKSDAKESIIDFMSELSASQQEAFMDLMSKVIAVDLSEHGGLGEKVQEKLSEDDAEEKVIVLAEKFMKEAETKGAPIDAAKAQKMAFAEIYKA